MPKTFQRTGIGNGGDQLLHKVRKYHDQRVKISVVDNGQTSWNVGKRGQEGEETAIRFGGGLMRS
jgi:hypothetical protein